MRKRIGSFISGISDALSFNQATLSGALDVIVIEHEDGSMFCTPFHVRFGKFKLLRSMQKKVRIAVNGKLTDICMRLGKAGEAYFIKDETFNDNTDLAPSPIISPDPQCLLENLEDLEEDEEDKKSVEELLVKSPEAIMKELEQETIQTRWAWPWAKPPAETKPKSSYIGSIFGMFRKKSVSIETKLEANESFVMSLCGYSETDINSKIFEENIVSYEDFQSNPWEIISDPKFVVKIDGKFYNWESAAPHIISMLAFKKPLDEEKSPTLSLKEENKLENGDKLPDIEIIVDTKEEVIYEKTLLLTSQQLKHLNLSKGVNTVTYTVEGDYRGEQSITGKIYLWDSNSKIVVSDIDGTITRSDVLGQFLPLVGKDWSHPGVVTLYNSIIQNGYKLLYLSSRAIGQVGITKGYLNSLNQNNQVLPDGPVIMSPDRLVVSFIREVIKRMPQKFKAGVLRDVASLFPEEVNPFYAGFGNRDTDAIAYRAAGISLHKIFIINPNGNVKTINQTFVKSYLELNDVVSELFPSLNDVQDWEYTDLNYWKVHNAPNLEDDIE